MNPVSLFAPADAGDNRRGIAAMLTAMALLIGNDVLIKLASPVVGTGEIILVRGLVASGCLFAFAAIRRELNQWATLLQPMVVVRILCEVGATVLFLIALFQMPIGQVTAIMQFSPLVATAGSAVFLGEEVGWRRWLATLAGFCGVLLIVKPGLAGFDWASLYVLGAVGFVAVRDLCTRRIRPGTSSLMTTLATAGAVTLLGAVMALGEPWAALAARELGLLAGAGLFIMCSYFLVVVAMRSGDVSIISAYRYSIVIWATLAGYLVWGEVPDLWSVLGIAVLVATGIYTFRREARLKRQVTGGTVPQA